MKACPNHNTDEYKLLESTLGKAHTYAIFEQNNFQLPSLEECEQIIGIHNKKIETETKIVINEILEEGESKVTTIIEDFSDVIRTRTKAILNNKNYEKLNKLLTSDTGLNKWETLNNLLNDAKKLKLDDIDIEKNLNNLLLKARAIGLGVMQMANMVDLISQDIKDISENSGDALKNITVLQYHLYALKDFKIFLQEASKTFEGSKVIKNKIADILINIENTEKDIIKNDTQGLITAFKPYLTRNINTFLKYHQEEKERQEKLLLNSTNIENKAIYQKNIDSLKKLIDEWDLTQNENILAFLQGLRGDANLATTLLQAYSNNTDPVTASFTNWLKDHLQEVETESLRFQKQLENEIAKDYEILSRFNPETVGKQLTNESVRLSSEGEEYKVVELLNEFSGTELFRGVKRSYQYIEKVFENEIKALKELIKNGENIKENSEKLHDKYKEQGEWLTENMQQEYIPEFYKRYELYMDKVGIELKKEIEKIFSDIRFIQYNASISNRELLDFEKQQIKDLYNEYILLGNVNNLDGTPKKGDALLLAEKMQEIRAINRKLFNYTPDMKAFEEAKQKYSNYISPLVYSKEEYQEMMEKWERENTRQVISPQFYEEKQAKIREIAFLTKDSKEFTKEITDKYGTFDSNWKIILDLEYGHRDEDNQVIGTEIQETGVDRIHEAYTNLEILHSLARKASGMSKEAYEEYQWLHLNKSSLDKEQLNRYNELHTKRKDKNSKNDRIQELFNDLRELQNSVPTPYYISVFNNITQKYGFSISETDSEDILKDEQKLKLLLKNTDFNEWFYRNHIKTEYWNQKTKKLETKYKRLPMWSFVMPSKEQFITREPSREYSIRDVKPEYKTGYNPITKQVELIVGEHIDNKGRFLPKKGKFKSEKYESLQNPSNKEEHALSNLLKIYTKYHLKAQEDKPNSHRLGLDIPRLLKSSTEDNMELLNKLKEKPADFPSLLWSKIVTKWQNATNFSIGEEGAFESVFTDKYGNEHTTIPVRYTGKLDVDKISLDLFKGIVRYNASLLLNKKLVEISPIQQALQRVVGTDKNAPLNLYKRIKNSIKGLIHPKSKTNHRQYAIQNIVTRVFEGQDKKMEIGEGGEKIASLLKSATVLKSIAFDIPASIANILNAEVQSFINTSNGSITGTNIAKAHNLFFTEYMPAFVKEYTENKLGYTSLQSQMFDLFNFVVSETYESNLGEKVNNSKLKDFIALNWLRNHRSWGELFVQSINALAFLDAVKVEQILSDGSKITIPLHKAYELDNEGLIKLKEGISESEWGINGTETKNLIRKIATHNYKVNGNYAKGIDKPESDTYTLYSLFTMMKRFFVEMSINRLGTSGIKKTTTKGLVFQPRYNQQTGVTLGFYLETLNIISKQIENKLVTGEFDSLTDEEKITLLKSIKETSVILLGMFLLQFVFDFNPEDEDKWEKIRKNSWLKNQGIYQSARLVTESSTFLNPYQYKDFILSEPFVAKTLTDYFDLVRFTLNGAEYETSTGIYEAGESKSKARLYKVLGVEKVIKSGTEDQTETYMRLRVK